MKDQGEEAECAASQQQGTCGGQVVRIAVWSLRSSQQGQGSKTKQQDDPELPVQGHAQDRFIERVSVSLFQAGTDHAEPEHQDGDLPRKPGGMDLNQQTADALVESGERSFPHVGQCLGPVRHLAGASIAGENSVGDGHLEILKGRHGQEPTPSSQDHTHAERMHHGGPSAVARLCREQNEDAGWQCIGERRQVRRHDHSRHPAGEQPELPVTTSELS